MIHYVINMDGLAEIEAALGKSKDKSKMALRTAINNAAKEVEKRMAKEAGQRYARHEGGMRPYREINSIKKAKVGKLEAIIEAKDRASDLYDYKLSSRTYFPGSVGAPNWIKAKQMKSAKMQKMALRKTGRDKYKAFVVRYQNGHIALAERIPGTHMKGRPEKEAIRSLYATSKPKAEEVVFKRDIDDEVQDILARNIEAQIYRYMG